MQPLNKIFTPPQNEAVTRSFAQMCLPVPYDGEYVETYNPAKPKPGGLVFHPAGLVIRATTDERTVSHGLVIPEIGVAYTQTDATRGSTPNSGAMKLRISLLPGLANTPVGHDDLEWVQRQLERDKVFWGDPTEHNIKRLPVTSHDFPQGIPIVADPDFLQSRQPGFPLTGRPHTGPDGYAKHALATLLSVGANKSEAQQWTAGIDTLQNTWNRASAAPGQFSTPTDMRNFWDTAQRFSQQGMGTSAVALLARGWEDLQDAAPTCKIGRVYVAGQKYKARLNNGMSL